jgi:hypothetical protein
MPLESRLLGQFFCFPEPNKKVGTPCCSQPASYSSPPEEAKETDPLENDQGVFSAALLSNLVQKFLKTGRGVMTDVTQSCL